jgi:hypothetical protein
VRLRRFAVVIVDESSKAYPFVALDLALVDKLLMEAIR